MPAYAGRLFDYHFEHPELVRLVQWARLEGRFTPAAYDKRAGSHGRRTAAIQEAQQRGHATSRLAAHQILTLIESIAVGWTITTAEFLTGADAPPEHREVHRQIIIDSVRRLTSEP